MNLEPLRACIGTHGLGKEDVARLVLCLGPWRFLALVVAFALVGTVLSLLIERRNKMKGENAELSNKELERRTKEMQERWNRRLF